MFTRSRLWLWFVVVCCCCLSGCVTHSVRQDGISFHYEWWLPGSLFLGSIGVVPIGLSLRQTQARWGYALLIGSPIVALVLGPSLLLEQVLVRDSGFEVHSGFWGMTANEQVKFESVVSCRLAQEKTTGKRPRMIEVLYFDLKDGAPVRLPLNNDVKIEAAKEIVVRIAKLGIPMPGFN